MPVHGRELISGRSRMLPLLVVSRILVTGFAAGEGCAFLLGCVESEGVAIQDGSQLGQAPVLEQAWVARELFNEGIQHLLGMFGDLLHHLVDVSCTNNV